MELGSSRQWLRVVQSKIVHLNLEVAVRVFESLQESSADTSNFFVRPKHLNHFLKDVFIRPL